MVGGGRAARAALCLVALAHAAGLRASGVDGAGRLMVVPLAFTGQPRESVVTLTNPNAEPVTVSTWYVGAEGTPQAASVVGVLECEEQVVPAGGARAVRLRDLCPQAFMPDRENFGYLWMRSRADASENVFVATSVDSPGASFGIAGQPVGAFDPALSPAGGTTGLEVAGLRTRQSLGERPVCFVASLGEPKKVELTLSESTGAPLGSAVSVGLDADRMQRVDLQSAFALPPADRDGLRLSIASADASLVVAGCGAEHAATRTIAYQPAQSSEPVDRARLHSVVVHAGLEEGPYSLGAPFWHTAFGSPSSRKVVLSTYLRSNDEVRCVLERWVLQPDAHDATAWTEIQMRDPLGVVVGGGSGAKDTGVVKTRPRGTYGASVTQRYFVDISFDEGGPSFPWPNQVHLGGWQVACRSAAGMSEPVGVPVVAADDF